MVSDASKKKAAAKKAAAVAKRGSKSAAGGAASKLEEVENGSAQRAADELAALSITDRTCTGVLASHPLSRDIHVSRLLIIHPRLMSFGTQDRVVWAWDRKVWSQLLMRVSFPRLRVSLLRFTGMSWFPIPLLSLIMEGRNCVYVIIVYRFTFLGGGLLRESGIEGVLESWLSHDCVLVPGGMDY